LRQTLESLELRVQQRTAELAQALSTLREDQEKLLISEKMASLGRLTAGIAHEMNTPLAAVRGAMYKLAELTQEYRDSIGRPDVGADDHRTIAAEMQESIRLAESAAKVAANFVHSVKAQTRDLASHEHQLFNAVSVVQEALLLLSYALRHKNCVVDFKPDVDIIEMYGSPSRLAQVVTNLVTNAIDAMTDRGGGQISLRLVRDMTQVVMTVSDTGCGISPDVVTKIFDPMFTTKPFGQGTGLGLTLVHNIVTGEFGGRIDVTSQPGQGATFTLYFPLLKEKIHDTSVAK
jgi:signal transduction histidine kinase